MANAFADQVVVITGGGRGIGRATAIEFGAEGATLLLAGRRMDALQTAAAEALRAGANAAEIVHCDVAKDADLQALVGKAIAHFGRLDVLVNNAGVVAGGRLDEIGADDVERMSTVNVWAPIRLAQLALPHMRQNPGGIQDRKKEREALVRPGSEAVERLPKGVCRLGEAAVARPCREADASAPLSS